MVSRAEDRASSGGVAQQRVAARGWREVSGFQQARARKVLLLSDRASQDQS